MDYNFIYKSRSFIPFFITEGASYKTTAVGNKNALNFFQVRRKMS